MADLQAKMGDHVHAHRRRAYTNKSVIAVNENYQRVAIKEKATAITWFFCWYLAKVFVLWPSGGDCEEGCQEEIVWKIDINKHEDTVSEVSSGTRTALSEMSYSLEV